MIARRPEADGRGERAARVPESDPLAGGFAAIYARGPDGLIADEPARRHVVGEDLAPYVGRRRRLPRHAVGSNPHPRD